MARNIKWAAIMACHRLVEVSTMSKFTAVLTGLFPGALLLLFPAALSLSAAPSPCHAELLFDAEELIQASGSNIAVMGYSVPSFVFWNADTLRDLVIGEGGGTSAQGKVRVYLNSGTAAQPQFSTYFYAQSQGVDLVVPAAS